MKTISCLIFSVIVCMATTCAPQQPAQEKIRVILDTDANNEIDDQHAIAYLLFNGAAFDVEGITVNRTDTGGDIYQHVAEAKRIVRLAGLEEQIPVLRGASGSFTQISEHLDEPDFDGADAVRFIIEQAQATADHPLILLPIGKLTNIALALKKDPSLEKMVRVVWLGSNYPRRGEWNKENDPKALTFILDQTGVEFDMVTVRYGEPSGTDAVRATLEDIRSKMSDQGPRRFASVVGRHGGEFYTFGDYSVNLFENYPMSGDPPARPLFDMAAVAIVKNPDWAESRRIPAPELVEDGWVERPEYSRAITLWENFDRDAIMEDFYHSMENFELIK